MASCCPSGLKASVSPPSLPSVNFATSSPVAASRSWTSPLGLVVAIMVPSGEKASPLNHDWSDEAEIVLTSWPSWMFHSLSAPFRSEAARSLPRGWKSSPVSAPLAPFYVANGHYVIVYANTSPQVILGCANLTALS